ncbi:MAG: DUF3604 domain-containing protein [Roseobacter sp.]
MRVGIRSSTRLSIFGAIKRMEVYCTSGPRIGVWFFGGRDLCADEMHERQHFGALKLWTGSFIAR